jgi:hypothetical protein
MNEKSELLGKSHNVGTLNFLKCEDSKCSLNIKLAFNANDKKITKLYGEDSYSRTMLIKYKI